MPEEIINSLPDVLRSGQLAYGVQTKRFEERLQSYVGNPLIITVSCNSVFFALKVLNVDSNDEIIASPMSCLATNQPIAFVGAKIVWADIDPLTGSLDPDDVKKKITNRTKAIIHYHWGGYPGYIDELNALAKESGLFVIEDATESFGAEYKGKKLGNTNTDIVCYSFTPVRLPNAIDGGGLAFKDKTLFDKACLMRDYGIDRSTFRDNLGEISEASDVIIQGNGCTMNNVSGFIGASQMDFIEDLFQKQRENARGWATYIGRLPDVTPLKLSSDAIPSYWTYTLLSNKRDALLEQFRRNGFFASKMHFRNDFYSVFTGSNQVLKGVNEFSKKQLNVPCGWWVDEISI